MPSAFQRHQRANLRAPIGAGPVYPLKYVQAYLLDAQDLLTPSSMALGCLIAFDLVVLEDDLPTVQSVEGDGTTVVMTFVDQALPPSEIASPSRPIGRPS
jgi:hypothetical protein